MLRNYCTLPKSLYLKNLPLFGSRVNAHLIAITCTHRLLSIPSWPITELCVALQSCHSSLDDTPSEGDTLALSAQASQDTLGR